MNIEVRDVIAKKDHCFKNTGEIDLKVARDCLVVLVSNEEDVYYLTLATNNKNVMEVYQKYPRSHYLLAKKKCEGLKETSLINLKSIYKGDISGKLVVIIPTDEFRKIIKKFKLWQECNPDELYNEMKYMLDDVES